MRAARPAGAVAAEPTQALVPRGTPGREGASPFLPGAPLTPAVVLGLQRALGNRAVGRLLQQGRTRPAAAPAGVQRAPTRTAADQEEWEREREAQRRTHQANQKRVYDLLDDAQPPVEAPRKVPGVPADREQLFANTAAFIKARCIVVVLTPTLSTRLYPPGKRPMPPAALKGSLFFDEEVVYPQTGAKTEAVEGLDPKEPGLYIRTTGETAHADPGGRPLTMRFFMDREFPYETLRTVLIHETQHLADRHGPSAVEEDRGSFQEAGIAGVNRGEGDVGNQYRTEFRAYWLGDKGGGRSFGDPGKAAANTRKLRWGTILWWRYLDTGFKNERQEQIFWYMVDAGIYPWVRANYYFTPAFKTLVDAFDRPTGGNLINSLRIEDLRYELRETKQAVARLADAFRDAGEREEVEHGWDREEASLRERYDEIVASARTLDGGDRAFLATAAAKPFWDFFHDCFAPRLRIRRLETLKQHIEALARTAIQG